MSDLSRDIERSIAKLEKRLEALDTERAKLISELDSLTHQLERNPTQETQFLVFPNATVRNDSPAEAKISLIHRLFRGRDDVYARRWESPKTGKSGYQPAYHNEWVESVCDKRRVKCANCPHREFLPLTESVLRSHVADHERSGDRASRDFVIGIYPMLRDETCWFLAVDFDKSTWQQDSAAFLETCGLDGIPAGLERSRSGTCERKHQLYDMLMP